MTMRSPYRRATGMYGRAGVVARHALREIPAGPGHAAPAGDAAARIDEQRRLLDAVRGMPEPYRSALFHSRVDGLPPEVIARRLRVPAATVEARLRHALRLLGERMGASRAP